MAVKLKILKQFVDGEDTFKQNWRRHYSYKTIHKRDKTIRLHYYAAALHFTDCQLRQDLSAKYLKSVDGRFNSVINGMEEFGQLNSTGYEKNRCKTYWVKDYSLNPEYVSVEVDDEIYKIKDKIKFKKSRHKNTKLNQEIKENNLWLKSQIDKINKAQIKKEENREALKTNDIEEIREYFRNRGNERIKNEQEKPLNIHSDTTEMCATQNSINNKQIENENEKIESVKPETNIIENNEQEKEIRQTTIPDYERNKMCATIIDNNLNKNCISYLNLIKNYNQYTIFPERKNIYLPKADKFYILNKVDNNYINNSIGFSRLDVDLISNQRNIKPHFVRFYIGRIYSMLHRFEPVGYLKRGRFIVQDWFKPHSVRIYIQKIESYISDRLKYSAYKNTLESG